MEKLSALLYIGIIHLNLFGAKKGQVESFDLNRGLILKLYCCSKWFHDLVLKFSVYFIDIDVFKIVILRYPIKQLHLVY